MDLNLQKIMDKRIAAHHDKIDKIDKEKPNLIISKVVEFKIPDFDITGEPQKERSMILEQLNALDDCKEPVVYVFEIPATTDKKVLLEKFKAFRNKPISKDTLSVKRACARLNYNSDSSASNILYVGSKQKNLKNRIKQHLGYGAAGTYAMQLRFWFPSNIILQLHIIEVVNNDILTEVEAALATELKPLIGKAEK